MTNDSDLQTVINILLTYGKSDKIDVVFIKKKIGLSKSDIFRLFRELKYNQAIDYDEFTSRKNNDISNMIIKSINEDRLLDLQKKSKIQTVWRHIIKHKVPYIILLITIVSTIAIAAYFFYKDYPSDDPRSSKYYALTFVPLSSQNIAIKQGSPDSFNFRYHLIHEGNKCLTEGRLFYYPINQENNTCGENIFFFNTSKNLHILCKTEEVNPETDTTLNEMCHPYISYVCKERKTYETNFYDLIREFDNKMKSVNISKSCFLKEAIRLCLNDENHCSDNIDFKINYLQQ